MALPVAPVPFNRPLGHCRLVGTNLVVVVAGVVLILAFRPDCAQVIRLIHVLIKYNVIAAMVNNV